MATITLPAGSTSDDLQEAINGAGSGDFIELSGDMNFFGAVVIPVETFITIESTAGNAWYLRQTVFERHFIVRGSLSLSSVIVSGDATGAELSTKGGLEVSGNLNVTGDAMIANCYSRLGGAISIERGNLSIQNSRIISNFATNGGGVYAFNGATVIISDGEISENRAQSGGAVYLADDSRFEISGGTLQSNMAQSQGGGVYIGTGSALEMRAGVLAFNTVTFDSGSGAGVYVSRGGFMNLFGGAITQNTLNLTGAQGGTGAGVCVSGGRLDMSNGTISQNRSQQYGAGVAVTAGGSFYMSGGLITSNTAEQPGGGNKLSGGGLAIISGIASMSGGTISRNEAVYGGGVFLGYPGATCRFDMTGGFVEDNFAVLYGGGIHAQTGTSFVTFGDVNNQEVASVVRRNRTSNYGGGISAYGSNVSLSGGEIYENSADYGGGMSILFCDSFFMRNGTVYENQAARNGGGIFLSSNSPCALEDSLINHNQAGSSGGGIYLGASATLNVAGSSAITNNDAVSGNGGGIFTESYDYGSPASLSAYQNITTAPAVIFTGNRAVTAHLWPVNAGAFTNIGYETASITDPSGERHPLNNYDINYLGERQLSLYNVTYVANGGTGSFTSEELPEGQNYTVLSPEATSITRPGYDFAGWNTEADGSGTYYEPGSMLVIAANVTLYAQWTLAEGPYDVMYTANGGTGSYTDTNLPSGSAYTVLSPEATGISRQGYFFAGWNTKADGSGTYYEPGNTISIVANVTLYAQWMLEEVLYDVIYIANGGSGSYADRNLPSGTLYAVLSQMTVAIFRPGYTFAGWNTEADGSGTAYQPGDTITITGNVILYAQWTRDDTWGRHCYYHCRPRCVCCCRRVCCPRREYCLNYSRYDCL